jgi:hypothetical protein
MTLMRAFISISPFYIRNLHGIGDLGADVIANGTEKALCGFAMPGAARIEDFGQNGRGSGPKWRADEKTQVRAD